MSDKTCTTCGKKLYANNTTGLCAACKKAPSDGAVAARPGRSDTIKRFRVVATALGKDPDAILEEAADAWLELVRKAVED